MFNITLEHHEHFTAVYVNGHLATMIFAGTQAERASLTDEQFHYLATWSAGSDR